MHKVRALIMFFKLTARASRCDFYHRVDSSDTPLFLQICFCNDDAASQGCHIPDIIPCQRSLQCLFPKLSVDLAGPVELHRGSVCVSYVTDEHLPLLFYWKIFTAAGCYHDRMLFCWLGCVAVFLPALMSPWLGSFHHLLSTFFQL